MLSTVLAALGSIIVARILGSFDLGEVTIVMIPVNLAILLYDLGVNQALTKYVAQYKFEGKKDKLRGLLDAGLTLNLVSAIILALVLYFLSGPISTQFLQRPDLESLVKLASLYVFGQAFMTMSQSVLVGYDRMVSRSVILVLFSLLKSVIPPILVWIGLGPFGAIIGNVLSVSATGLVGITIVLLIRRTEKNGLVEEYKKAIQTLLIFGFPLYLGTIANGILQQLYNSLMAVYVAVDLIGNFNAAVNFGILVTFFTTPLSTVLMPLFSKMNNDKENLGFIFKKSVKYSTIITLPVALVLILLAKPVVQLVYGEGYPYTPFYLQLYLIVFLFQGLGALSVSSLAAGIGETHVSFKMSLISILIGLPLSLWLIPQYGVIGMIFCMIVAPRAGLIYGLWWIKKNLGFSFSSASSIKIYISALIPLVVCYAASLYIILSDILNLILFSVLYFIIYLALLPMTTAITLNDVRELTELSEVFGPFKKYINSILKVLKKLCRT